MSTEETIIEALTQAKNRGIIITRGALFDWRDKEDIYKQGVLPFKCNAIGALLLFYNMAEVELDPKWANKLCDRLGLTRTWLHRFVSGWDYGNCLEISYMDKKLKMTKVEKEITVFDKISYAADRLAVKWTSNKQ